MTLFERLTNYFKRWRKPKPPPVSPAIKMETQLRVDGTGKVRVVRAPVDEHAGT